MPSFFEGMKRMISGQPVFKPEEQDGVVHKSDQPQAAAPPSAQPQPTAQPAGPKEVPRVTGERVEMHLKGATDMEVVVAIRNESRTPVFLDKILILGTTKELDRDLSPGEEHEFPVYYGRRPNHTSYNRAEIHFRDNTGDYFSAHHLVEFEQQPDKTYIVRKLRFTPPVRDI